VLSHHRFLIQDVDESTLKLMESMPELFPMSDTRLVMQKVAQRMTEEQRATFQQLPCVNGCVPLQEVKQALRALFADFELSDHEVVTVLRQLDGERRGSIPLTHLIQSLFQQQQQQRPESGRSRPGSRSAARRQQAEEQQVAVVDSVKRAFRNQEGALIQAFRMADVSFSGLLSVDQFQRAICAASTTVGFALQESDVPLLVAAFYPTGVRHIEYDAFVQDLWG
jgi:Ca2+-binding EF-hand superfamily protein